MSEYVVRSWNAWHHHMALVMLAMLILLSYKIKFMKFESENAGHYKYITLLIKVND